MNTEAIKKQLEKRAVEASAAKMAHATKMNADIKKLTAEIKLNQGELDDYEKSLGKRLDEVDHPDAAIRSVYHAAKAKKAKIDTMTQALNINKEALGIFMQRFRSSITSIPPDEMPINELRNK